MNPSQLLRHSKVWDRTGMTLSSFCALHCLISPFLIPLVPFTKAFAQNPLWEFFIPFLSLLVGSVSLTTSYRQHHKPGPLLVGLMGLSLISLRLLFLKEEQSHYPFGNMELDLIMILGGILLVSAHGWNLWACHCFCHSPCRHEPLR